MIRSSRSGNESAIPSSNGSSDSPARSSSSPALDLRVEHDQIVITRDDRVYRIRGLEQATSPLRLNVSVLVSRDDLVYLDTIDLTKARARNQFIRATASELYRDEDLIKKDVGRILLALETLQAERIEAAKRPRSPLDSMTELQHDEALALLRDPLLTQRIVEDLEHCGMVGETTNMLAGYLAAVSRKLKRPLAVVIQSSSSAGKSSLMDAILAMMPPEEQHKLSSLTGQSLFYMERDRLRHAILAISEDEAFSRARSHAGQGAYALKLLQSEGELRHARVGKNAAGRMAAEEYVVEGPTQIFLTTTATALDEELLNRCLVLTVDESRQQTCAIHQRQRIAETRAGKLQAAAARKIRERHHNAQRLLRPLEVYNPHAMDLTFTTDKTRLRRDHAKYLGLINAIALLHQYQRVIHAEEIDGKTVESIEVIPSDIALANRLAAEILGRTLDELPPSFTSSSPM